jgi:hypothetical protein
MLLSAFLACGRGGRVRNVDTQYGEVQVGDVSLSFEQILPGDCQHVQTCAFTGEADENYDGRPDREWVVLYRFDLPAGGDRYGSPIGAAVYRLSNCRPPCLVPYELRPPEGEYLCECDCSADRADVLPRSDRPELIVRDRCEDEVTRLAIFEYSTFTQPYTIVGFFVGDRISLDRENGRVAVAQRLPADHPAARSQLARQTVCASADDEQGGLRRFGEKSELALFYCDALEEAALSPYPEKVLLAFYAHYADAEGLSSYFTDEGWQGVGECDSEECGCPVSRGRVARVRVTELRPVREWCSGGSGGGCHDQGNDRATVEAWVVCERKDDMEEPPTHVQWTLRRQSNRWYLDAAAASVEETPPQPVEDVCSFVQP